MSFSAMGRSALALASVVTMASAANSEAAMLANSSRWWAALPPNRLLLVGVPGMALRPLRAQGQAPLVELLQDLVERLLAEVGDGQQVFLGLVDQLANGVDLSPLEAVPGTLGQVELLDGQVQIR